MVYNIKTSKTKLNCNFHGLIICYTTLNLKISQYVKIWKFLKYNKYMFDNMPQALLFAESFLSQQHSINLCKHTRIIIKLKIRKGCSIIHSLQETFKKLALRLSSALFAFLLFFFYFLLWVECALCLTK